MSTRGMREQVMSSHQSEHSVTSLPSTSSSRSSERKSGRSGVESTVTRLLIAIRQLLEALTLWSNDNASEQQVSDVYVRLGNDFNSAVAAFSKYNIDMSDLISVPSDLREILEACLAEEANPANLEIYLPQVRQIITNLLQGLRVKQSSYRRIVDKARQSQGSRHDSERRDHDRARSSLVESNSIRSDGSSPSARRSHRSLYSNLPSTGHHPRDMTESTGNSTEPVDQFNDSPSFPPSRLSGAVSDQLSSPQAAAFSQETEREEQSRSPVSDPSALRTTVGPEVTRYSLSDPPMPAVYAPDGDQATAERSTPPTLRIQSSSDFGEEDFKKGSVAPANQIAETEQLARPPSLNSSDPPEMANSLRALKKSDTLERRASKRFSTYNFQKMTGSKGSNRRSVMVGGVSLTPADLATLAEDDEDRPSITRKPSREGVITETRIKRLKSGEPDEQPPPVPPLPVPSPSTSNLEIDGLPSKQERVSCSTGELKTQLTIFLQVGREVKKATIEPGTPLTAMRILFMDKFAYHPGHEDFPAIYIREPGSEIQYELEDVDEVKDRSLLLLNIDPLDQIKQHIDHQITKLSSDLKDLKSSMSTTQRASFHQAVLPLLSPSHTSAVPRPSEKQFRDAAKRLSKINSSDTATPPDSAPPALIPQTTGASTFTESTTSSRLVTDLRVQFDEVQNLRRDLAIMRQLYTGFITQTKESLAGIRTQAQTLQQTASTKVGGDRAFIDSGKVKLDGRSQNILTEVERLQDTVENLKEDVLKRQMLPKRGPMQALRTDITAASAELESLAEQMKTVKPIWKETWERELQNIVEEQSFLQHQEQLVQDLIDDHKQLEEIYSRIEKVVNIRSSNGAGSLSGRRGYRPPPPDEGHEGLSTVMLQIRGASVDPEKRMKAIEARQRARAKEQEERRTDEFRQELSGFVAGKKLRLTGGAEEVERVRQMKSQAVLQSMFNGEQTVPVSQ